jgi:hypothetical protein
MVGICSSERADIYECVVLVADVRYQILDEIGLVEPHQLELVMLSIGGFALLANQVIY